MQPTMIAPEPRLAPTVSLASVNVIQADEMSWIWRGTIPALNGLRAISILLVLASHLSFRDQSLLARLPRAGAIGVEMFFVISGFLITLLLLRERRRTDSIDLRAFYIRRALRILPAYFFFLGVIFALQQLEIVDIPGRAWFTAWTYSASLISPGNWDLGHLWSLSVEEHFYLAWPFLFLLLSPKSALRGIVACIGLTPILRLGIFFIQDQSFDLPIPPVNYFTLTRLDAIAVGCGLAFLCIRPNFVQRTRLSPRVSQGLIALGIIGLAASYLLCERYEHHRAVAIYHATLAGTCQPLLLAGVLWLCLRNDCGFLTRLLNLGVMRGIGVLSYSIYLWQQIFLNPHRTDGIGSFPLNLGLTLGMACFSYFLIELPFLMFKEQFRTNGG